MVGLSGWSKQTALDDDSGVPPQAGSHCAVSQVSQAAAELQQYCIQNACKDALLLGVPAGSNPFREPRSCALL